MGLYPLLERSKTIKKVANITAGTECFDIFSRAPGDSEVTSQSFNSIPRKRKPREDLCGYPFRGHQDDPCSPDASAGVPVADQRTEPIKSAEETERVTPARIPQTRTPQARSESLIGFKCQI